MTRPRGGDGCRGRSSSRNRGVAANSNVVHGFSGGQVINKDQAATSHREVFVMVHDVITEDINEDTAVKSLKTKKKTVPTLRFEPMK